MDPRVFITDFERTENTDELHGMLGRALIVATRFEAMCEAAAIFFKLNLNHAAIIKALANDVEYNKYVSKILNKSRNLYQNINGLLFPEEISRYLHEARESRNYIAHELARSLTGCLDNIVSEQVLLQDVSDHVGKIAIGDIIISTLITAGNGHPMPIQQFLESYPKKVRKWVVER